MGLFKSKGQKELEKKQKRLYKYYLTDEARENILKVTHYAKCDLDRYEFAKYYSSEEGQKELEKAIEWDNWYESQVEAMEEHNKKNGEE